MSVHMDTIVLVHLLQCPHGYFKISTFFNVNNDMELWMHSSCALISIYLNFFPSHDLQTLPDKLTYIFDLIPKKEFQSVHVYKRCCVQMFLYICTRLYLLGVHIYTNVYSNNIEKQIHDLSGPSAKYMTIIQAQ